MAGSANDWATTYTSPFATDPTRLMVKPGLALPLKYIWILYPPAARSMAAPVPLYISRALLLLEPSIYSEKNRSVGAAAWAVCEAGARLSAIANNMAITRNVICLFMISPQ